MAEIKLKKIKSPSPVGMDRPSEATYLPGFSADDNQIPEITDWEVGKSYKMIIKVKQKSKSEGTFNGAKVSDGRFDIVAYKVLEDKAIEDMTDEEFGEYQGQKLSGK